LRPKKREDKVGGVAIATTFNGANINLDLRLQRSPGSARSPSVKGRFCEGETFGIGKGRMRSGARREVEQGLMRPCTILNFDVSLGRAAFGEIWVLIWGAI
jgi:hypothetical protein